MIDNCLLTFLLAAQISVVPPAEIERALVQTQARILGESSLPAAMDTTTLRTAIDTQLESLERKEKALRERLLAINALPDLNAEQRFEKDWIERQSVDQSRLRESLLAQREVLLKAAQTNSLHASAREELRLCIEQLAQHIDIISGDIAVERTQWRVYHEACANGSPLGGSHERTCDEYRAPSPRCGGLAALRLPSISGKAAPPDGTWRYPPGAASGRSCTPPNSEEYTRRCTHE